ncbi:hypothetical protein [Spirosoma radiotolerans]|uniref:DUF1425 domain-containing protein n=1 Tax=Spirosoma radiotolerans TaxID=1379870 RepID=A0A0E3ZTU6_9BACT|nr:hypothetical protein [Spirosoma radiotolerans]AKD54049.1 hypothetical protein SD10_03145 [Spirosoma radiotolerans]
MKTIRTITLLMGAFVALNACTPKMTFTNSSVVPAAAGTINVKKDKNENYTLNVRVHNLAESKKLTPAKDTYLVWMKQNDNSVKKLGQLSPSGKALTATLTATAVAKPQAVFITAEDNADMLYPAGQTILTTEE